jgi:hypothetical protein
MREYSKQVVFKFDEAVRKTINQDDLKTFKRVANEIVELINSRSIYQTEEKTT